MMIVWSYLYDDCLVMSCFYDDCLVWSCPHCDCLVWCGLVWTGLILPCLNSSWTLVLPPFFRHRECVFLVESVRDFVLHLYVR